MEEAIFEEFEDVLFKVEVYEIEIGKMKFDIEELMEVVMNNKIEIQKNKVVIKSFVVYVCVISVVFGVYVFY